MKLAWKKVIVLLIRHLQWAANMVQNTIVQTIRASFAPGTLAEIARQGKPKSDRMTKKKKRATI
ncbi:MAG: hypothetical protein HY606_14875 [Planctomycetes bacterium]|nr:hypothetical protein [Planctomycetota bacterium]